MKEIITYKDFNDYYNATNGNIKSKYSDFHIFRFNELGENVVEMHGPFKTDYFQFAIGSNLHSEVSVFNQIHISEKFSLIIFKPGQIIEWKRTGSWDGFVINVKENFLDAFQNNTLSHKLDYLLKLDSLIFQITENDYNHLTHLYEMIYFEHTSEGKDNLLVIKNLLNALLIYLNRIMQNEVFKDNPYINLEYQQLANQFKNLVLSNYLENKSVDFYLEKMQVSAVKLNHAIKLIHGKSPKGLINDILLLHAKTMLNSNKKTVTELAYDLNFDDYSHFVKFFKKHTGLTPAAFQKNKN